MATSMTSSKLPWMNPVLVFAHSDSMYYRFRSLHNIVIVQETVSHISIQQMADLSELNERFKTKLMACPFIILDSGKGVTIAFSPDGTSGPVDLDSMPLVDIEAPIDEGIILVNCVSLMTVYSQRESVSFRLRMHDLIMSSVMCMPTKLYTDDIPFLLERRREYTEKQLDNSRIVLQNSSSLSLYNARNFALIKTIYNNTS